MALNSLKCNYLTPLHFKGLNNVVHNAENIFYIYNHIIIQVCRIK